MHRALRRGAALLLASALLLALAGCVLLPDTSGGTLQTAERTLFLMDTQMELRLYVPDEAAGREALDELEALLTQLDGRLSVTNPDSVLSRANRLGQSDDPELLELAGRALQMHGQTGGALDISLYPASRLWGFSTGSYRVPAPEELEALRPAVGMDRLTLSPEQLVLAEGMQLDLGALGKGYAADRCRELLEQRKCSGILNLGGNLQTVGEKPDGSDWVIGIQDPDDMGAYLLTLRLPGSRAVVTSGDYQRYFEQDGVRYCHILDPKTLSPVRNSLRSVTVVADSGLQADGLATALFVLGLDDGLALWRASRGFEAVWIEDDGTVTVTSGLKELASGCAFEVAEP